MPVSSRTGVVGVPSGQFVATKTRASAEAPHQWPHRTSQQHQQEPSRHSNTSHAKTVPAAARDRSNGTFDSSDGMQVQLEDETEGQPPAKKRKLSIRRVSAHHHHQQQQQQQQQQSQHHHHHHQQQSTLDAFLARSSTLKPPNTIVRQEPHGPLQQTVNGVRRPLVAGEDELRRPSPKPERMYARERAGKSPKPQAPVSVSAPVQPKQEDKRSLRSHDDGPRLKSELAVYFPHYEDVIFDAPKEHEFLTQDTALYITDDTKKEDSSPAKLTKSATHSRKASVKGSAGPPGTPQRSLSNQFNGSPSLNLDFASKTLPDNPDDPLADEHFLKSHKRAERKEKQLRNIERERAMHEKVQLDRLLDGLQGHDWLRVLGITGVTETEAKKYEPKRDYFIAEVQALVDKFKQWKEQEKKLRLEKEAAQAAKDAEDEEDDSTEGSVEPPSSDLNASAARQLQQEVANALKAKVSSKGKSRAQGSGYASTSHPATPATPGPIKLMLPPAPPSPEIPITSFYAKPHLRDAALSKTRHGRNVTAFGLPLPEMEEQEFELPPDYVTEDALRATARERRRRKRESAANTSGSR